MVGMRRRQSGFGCTGSSWVAGSALLLAVALAVLLLGCAVPASAELKAPLTVSSPFDKHDHKGSRIIPYWEKSGSTNIMQTFVRVSLFIAYCQYASVSYLDMLRVICTGSSSSIT